MLPNFLSTLRIWNIFMANTDLSERLTKYLFSLGFSVSEQETILEARMAGCAVISIFFLIGILCHSLFFLLMWITYCDASYRFVRLYNMIINWNTHLFLPFSFSNQFSVSFTLPLTTKCLFIVLSVNEYILTVDLSY